jgi:hypothetical protein
MAPGKSKTAAAPICSGSWIINTLSNPEAEATSSATKSFVLLSNLGAALIDGVADRQTRWVGFNALLYFEDSGDHGTSPLPQCLHALSLRFFPRQHHHLSNATLSSESSTVWLIDLPFSSTE